MSDQITPEQETAAAKAASAGFSQSLINCGFKPEVVKQATAAYINPQSGLLVKRAKNMQTMQQAVANKLQEIRSGAAAK